MNRKFFKPLLLFWLLQTLAMDVLSAPFEAVTQPAAGTVTQFVQIFGELERGLQSAISRNDKSGIDALLSPDFEMWASSRPGAPVPRADWLAQLLSHPDTFSARTITQMAVNGFCDHALVSFKWGGTPDFFVIDNWRNYNGGWLLETRFIGPAGDTQTLIPGLDIKSPVIEKKF